jgi:hypothetical protein
MSMQRSASRVRSTYEFIKAHRTQYSVQAMCGVLAVAPSGYLRMASAADLEPRARGCPTASRHPGVVRRESRHLTVTRANKGLGDRHQCAAASGVGDERKGRLASRTRLAGAGCKPPQAAWVKSLGRERCGKGAIRHQVRTNEGEHP